METTRFRLVRKVCKALPFYLLTFLPLSAAAQSFTQRIQQTGVGQGTVRVHQEAEIDALVNGPAVTTQPANPRQQNNNGRSGQQRTQQGNNGTHQGNNGDQQSGGNTTQQGGNNGNQQGGGNATQQGDTSTQTNITDVQTTQTTDSLQQTPRRMRRVIGYRIQAFVGGKTRADRQKAEQVGNTLRTLFPGHTVYVHFYSPRWICRIGNYRSYEEAKAMCDEVVRAGYESATIVKGRITVPY